MSFKKGSLYPANPATARGAATKLSSSKDKIVYTNGRSVIVSITAHPKSYLIHEKCPLLVDS